MKIVAESAKRRNKTVFTVKVLDGSDVVQQQVATTVIGRDKLIWEFAEQFNTTDISIVEPDKRPRSGRGAGKSSKQIFKFSEIPSIPVLDLQDAADYFDNNERVVYNRVIVAVKEGVDSGRDSIRLFELNGTGVYITSDKEDWRSGLEGAERFFAETQEFEKCAVCRDLLLKL